MDDFAAQANDAAAGKTGRILGGASFSTLEHRSQGNNAMPPNAAAQGSAGAAKAQEVTLPCLQEMGDIAPAIEVLLRLQAEYARREPGVSRAMCDVAYNAVAAEIECYIRGRCRGDGESAK